MEASAVPVAANRLMSLKSRQNFAGARRSGRREGKFCRAILAAFGKTCRAPPAPVVGQRGKVCQAKPGTVCPVACPDPGDQRALFPKSKA
jgi:hypothetical protein